VNRDMATSIARDLIASAGRLGYVAGRYEQAASSSRSRAVRRHVGSVMGGIYTVLWPIWAEHPDLDPAESNNPLGIPKDSPPGDELCTLAHTRECLADLEAAVALQMPRLISALEGDRARSYMAVQYEELQEAVRLLRSTLDAQDAVSEH
jgi:hypothetical protein